MSENFSKIKIVWAKNETSFYFPAIIFPSKYHDQLITLIKSILVKINFFSNYQAIDSPDNNVWPICSSCGWVLCYPFIFLCRKHSNVFCPQCFRLLKRCLRQAIPQRNFKFPKKGCKYFENSHDPSRRTFKWREEREKSINQFISSDHLAFFDVIQNQSKEENILNENNANSLLKMKKEVESSLRRKNKKEIVFWFGRSDQRHFSTVSREEVKDFESNFSELSNKKHQPMNDIQFEHFRKAVNFALRFLGKKDVRCQVLSIIFQYYNAIILISLLLFKGNEKIIKL